MDGNANDQAGSATRRDGEIRRIVADMLRRPGEGEQITDAQVIAEHPALMPDLATELVKARKILAARLAADHADDDSRFTAKTITRAPNDQID